MRTGGLLLTLLAMMFSTRDLSAQVTSTRRIADAVNAEAARQAAAITLNAERRACDGCPRRSVGRAFLDATAVNVFYEVANLARGQVTARITPKTWWANMQQGWVWDLDDFLVNQIGHPYQGNNYFNSGRANGLNYWESAGITAFGSSTWEYFGETNHASLNDLINTTLGGMALGEMFHRAAWLVRAPQATGGNRLMKEIAATAIDPVTGLTRFMSGDASRTSEKPPEMVPSSMQALVSTGVLWRGSDTRAVNATGEPFLQMDMRYGDLTAGRSRTPYDAFGVFLRFGGGGPISDVRLRGRLLGQPLRQGRIQLNVSQDYDFNQNAAYRFGAQSFEVSTGGSSSLSSRTSVWVSGWAGVTVLGAVDSLPPGQTQPIEEPPDDGSAGQGVSEGPRNYDYGPGTNFGGIARFTHSGRVFAVVAYEAHHLHTLDGIRANHLLQQMGIDLLAPVRGALGAGVSGEYFDRRTFYQDGSAPGKFQFPQFRVFLTWNAS